MRTLFVLAFLAVAPVFAQDARSDGFAGDDPNGGSWVQITVSDELRVFLDTTSVDLRRDTVMATTWWASAEPQAFPPEPTFDRTVQVSNFHCRAKVIETLDLKAYHEGSENGGESYEPGEAVQYVWAYSIGHEVLREVCERAGWDPDTDPGPRIQIRGGLPLPPPPPGRG